MGWDDNFRRYDTSTGFGSKDEWSETFRTRFTKQEAEEILSHDDSTPWGVLGVTLSATKKEIKAAYRALMIIWHPDKNPDRLEEATAMSKKINAAYSIIG